jgi:glycosyltransferase involved in cell wall biosynthesis
LKIAVVIRSAPESYPPTLNAISRWCADPAVSAVFVFAPNIEFTPWVYPQKTRRIVCNQALIPVDVAMRLSGWAKLCRFLGYARRLLALLKTEQPDVVMLIDEGPVLAYSWIRWLLPRQYQPVLWYHNHDVVEKPAAGLRGLLNLTARGVRAQYWLFPTLAAFTLPANERRRFFPMLLLRGLYAEIPNCPDVDFYSQFFQPTCIPGPDTGSDFRLIFQGAIGPGHGLEALLDLAHSGQFERRLVLVVKGWAQPEYAAALKQKVADLGLTAQFEWHGFGAYSDVPRLAAGCHAGIAIHSGNDAMNTSLGRASNKIYEYAALGLPVLLFDSAHFRTHLKSNSWALFTDVTQASLLNCLRQILRDYSALKSAARADFLRTNNFGYFFDPVWQKIKQNQGLS